MKFRKTIPSTWVMLLLAGCVVALAEQPATEKPQGSFIRLLRDADENPIALQVAIVRCASTDRTRRRLTVDLVAAVHVAEKSYFEQLNRAFATYDAVLYELVAPAGTRVPTGGRKSDSPVSALQNGMKHMLELEFQLDVIDYSPNNLVHADMSPKQFADLMQQRGESTFGMFLRMMGYAMARQHASEKGLNNAQLLMALFDKNRALALKRIMAEQFEDMEGALLAVEGPKGSTMISERNKVALKVLGKQIAAGKRKIAIFYGAGHMPDMLKRLRDDFRLKPVETRWLDAWHLKAVGGG